ncbi:TRR2 [Symbiodinium microadriaticum]|nr:TRR2 [Symbiodinium microadriaticum]
MALPAEPAAKRVKLDGQRLSDELTEAQSDYEKTREELRRAYAADVRDEGLIQFLTTTMQNAHSRYQAILTALSEQSEVPVKELKDAVEKNTHVVCQVGNMVLQMSAVRPIRADADRTRKRSCWGSDVRKHFQLPDGELVCSVLSHMYADTMFQAHEWCRSKGWGSPFPAVAEHIVPESQPGAAAAFGLEVCDPCNAFPLLKHIELMYQEGKLSIMPSGQPRDANGVELVVHVSQRFHREAVQYKQDRTPPRQIPKDPDVQVYIGNRRHRLTWGDLHEKTFRMSTPPSMRSLYQKAKMAWEQTHKHGGGIPNPTLEENFVNFLRHCSKLGDIFTGALHHVPP